MAAVRFGTDGIRGIAGESLTDPIAYALGRALAARFPGGTILIGRDTRPSGAGLSAALAAGANAAGAHAIDLGVIPTPGLAAVVAGEPTASCGVVVTASHNPVEYNGLKVLGRDGRKIADVVERELEAAIGAELARGAGTASDQVRGASSTVEGESYRARYTAQLAATAAVAAPDSAATAIRVLVDAANGAGAPFAVAALTATGAKVEGMALGDGVINDAVGATSPEALGARVLASGVDIGIALDGDADRCAVVDERGQLVDGDVVIGLIALDRKARGLPHSDQVVATILTNSGIERHLAAAGIKLQRTPVGDRHIAEALAGKEEGFGGEKSGHLLFPEHAPTGDGLISAIEVIALCARANQPLSQLAAALPLDPQVQRVIRVEEGEAESLLADPRFTEVLREVEALLRTGGGRILVRPSGTEPLLRVMAEGPDAAVVASAAERLLSAAASLLDRRS
jgi:phosphoglucosamine mutase